MNQLILMRYMYVHLLDFFLNVTEGKLYLGTNDFSGSIPDPICALRNTSLSELIADCTNCPNGTAGAGECCNPTCFP